MKYDKQGFFISSFVLLVLATIIAIGLTATPQTAAVGITTTPTNTPASLFLPAAPYILVTDTPTPTLTILPTVVLTVTPIISVTPTNTLTPTVTHTATPSPTSSVTPTPSPTIECDYGPYTLPHYLQFENYTCGGEGIAYHDVDPTNNGDEYRLDEGVDIGWMPPSEVSHRYYVGWTEAGEWLTYRVYLDYLAEYYFWFHVSSLSDIGRFHLEIDDVNVTGSLVVPNTGDVQNWQRVVAPEGTVLESGYHTFKLVIESGGGNFDNVKMFAATPTPTHTPVP